MSVSLIKKSFSTLLLEKRLHYCSNPARNLNILSSKLVYSAYGEPSKVVCKEDEIVCNPNDCDVIVKMLAAPVNPSDINTIQGKYPEKPKTLPAVPGNEGVAEVLFVGCDVDGVEIGDHVVPFTNLLGTWRTHAKFKGDEVLRVPKELGIAEAATLTVNPCTAYRMLKDFVTLQCEDVVIQNGANSACGQNVIQLASIWGMKTVNIVRDRPNISELKNYLKTLGATEVLTEEELSKTDLFKSKKLPRPRLALNCVGGKNAVNVLRQLDQGGTMVTYGGMSREPVIVPTTALIFKDVNVLGFWVTRWSKQNHDAPERYDMFNELIKHMISGDLHAPQHKMVPFNNYKEAMENALTTKGMLGLKYLLQFEEC